MRVLIRSLSAARTLSLRQTQKFAFSSFRQFPQSSILPQSSRFAQTMCQGHEDPPAAESTSRPASASSQHSAQSDQKKKQKAEWKQKKQQLNKAHTPPATPPPPTHEIVKTGSAKLANGTRYIDTHCHTLMTVQMYQEKAKAQDPQIVDIPSFMKEFFPEECAAIVDIYCDPPFTGWKDLASHEDLPLKYYFAMGCHPHNAKRYNDAIEHTILEAMKHPKCVAWGEMGLDYHYNLSSPDVQRKVLVRQLEKALAIKKHLVIHTREADDDILQILTDHVPVETHIHVHCFTDTPHLASTLLSHFPNLFIGITGVITYASNRNTTEVVKNTPLERLLLETDSPFMTPNNVQKSIKGLGGKSTRLNVCWSGLIPWTAEWVANIKGVSVEEVLDVTRKNAERMYGITSD